MTKNDKYQQTVILCYSPVPSCKEAVDRGSNVIFGHTFTNVCSKIETGFYFAFSSLTLQTFAILYFSYLQLWISHHFSESFSFELFELLYLWMYILFSDSDNRKYANLVGTQVEIIYDPNYLLCIFIERWFLKHLFSAHFLLFQTFRGRKSTRIYVSCFTKVCNIQKTQYSKTILVYYWFFCTPKRGGSVFLSWHLPFFLFVLLIVWNYVKGLYKKFPKC